MCWRRGHVFDSIGYEPAMDSFTYSMHEASRVEGY